MRKIFLMISAVGFLSGISSADSVLISTFAPTAVINSGFYGKATTIIYPSAASVIWLNTQPIASTTAFVASGFQLNVSSTTPLVMPDFHGNVWGMAPTLASPATLYFLSGN